ncbi:universal stress protein [Reinekea sp.]|jgi:nucleotide-binding universal stress UspA family protein|uniref:universal stress protein n=1 Tax=Reinekea sp. TaxID=1970455 RepID=UPI003989FE96
MYKLIVAPIDLTAPEVSERILARTLFHLNNSQCEVYFLSVAPVNANDMSLDQTRSELMAFAHEHISAHEGRIHLEIIQGKPSSSILSFAEAKKANCIIVGAHRGTNQLGLNSLGSTAAIVAAQAPSDVYIVKDIT